jgi:hypothetical protein
MSRWRERLEQFAGTYPHDAAEYHPGLTPRFEQRMPLRHDCVRLRGCALLYNQTR